MSIAAPDQKRSWLMVAVAVGTLFLLVTGLVFLDLPGERLLSPGGDETLASETAQALPQAPWKIKAHPAGVLGKVTKAQAARIQRQRPQVVSLVKRVYDALLVHPGRLGSTLEKTFTPAAATALRRSGAAVARAGVVTTKKRSAQIGIQAAGGPTLAVASVSVRALLADDLSRRLGHHSTLWMERGKKGWKVVAFQVDQRPLRAGADSKKKSNKGKRG